MNLAEVMLRRVHPVDYIKENGRELDEDDSPHKGYAYHEIVGVVQLGFLLLENEDEDSKDEYDYAIGVHHADAPTSGSGLPQFSLTEDVLVRSLGIDAYCYLKHKLGLEKETIYMQKFSDSSYLYTDLTFDMLSSFIKCIQKEHGTFF